MIPRPPRSTRTVTPFPYTELVRSWRDATARCRGALAVAHGLADVTCSRLAEASVGCLLFLNGRHLTGVAVKREVEGNLVADLHAVEQFGFRRSEEHTSELQSLMRISYAVFCLKKKKIQHQSN